jgi:hypothetical protein
MQLASNAATGTGADMPSQVQEAYSEVFSLNATSDNAMPSQHDRRTKNLIAIFLQHPRAGF